MRKGEKVTKNITAWGIKQCEKVKS